MEQFWRGLQRFGLGRLAALVGVGAGVAIALTALTMTLGKEPEGLLYSGLDLKEAASVTQALDQAGIKYSVKGDGSTIMVPRDKVASSRLLVAGKGLVTSGSVGYEIFDTTNALGQTDFVQQLNRQRALEGELVRTISQWDGVSSARVHLVLPKRQLFEDEDGVASASVALNTGGRDPSPDMVRAVQNLVAGAAPGMKPERVTVVDQHGKTLSAASDGSVAGQIADDRRSEFETRVAKQVKDLVEGVVGPGKAQVKVTADLDLTHVTLQEEKFDPDGQVVRSESTTDQNSSETRADENAATSASQNIPGGQTNPNFIPTGSKSGANESVTNYEISKSVRTQVQDPGQVKKLSVAVAVDGITTPGPKGKPPTYAPRSAQEMQQIEQLVRAAVGYDQERGDVVTVVPLRFPTADDQGGVTSASPLMGFDKNDIMRIAEIVVLAIVAVLILLFAVRPLFKAGGGTGGGAMAGGGMSMEMPMLAAAGGGGGGGMIPGPNGTLRMTPQLEGGASGGPQHTGPEIDARIDIAKIEGQVKASSVKRVSEFVEKHPEESVSILRGWLHETS